MDASGATMTVRMSNISFNVCSCRFTQLRLEYFKQRRKRALRLRPWRVQGVFKVAQKCWEKSRESRGKVEEKLLRL